MSTRPSFTVEYLEPVAIEAEPLPDEFSASRLQRSLLILAAIVAGGRRGDRARPRPRARCATASAARSPSWLVVRRRPPARLVRVLRARVPRRVLPPHELAHEHGDRALRAGRELAVLGRRRGRARARRVDPAPRRAARVATSRSRTVAFFLLTSLANVGFLALGGIALATGLLNGAPELLLGLAPRARRGWPRSRSRSARAGSRRRWRGARCAPSSSRRRRRSATASTRRCGSCDRRDPRILFGAVRLHALRRRDARRLLRRLRQRRPARRRPARRLHHRPARQPDPDPRRDRRRRRRPDRHARALRRRRRPTPPSP